MRARWASREFAGGHAQSLEDGDVGGEQVCIHLDMAPLHHSVHTAQLTDWNYVQCHTSRSHLRGLSLSLTLNHSEFFVIYHSRYLVLNSRPQLPLLSY